MPAGPLESDVVSPATGHKLATIVEGRVGDVRTVFADVTADMRIAREEIFGPVLSVFRWEDEEEVIRQVNAVEYGLTFSVWTNDVTKAHRTIKRAEAGFRWINEVGRHALGTPFGGYKQSGIGSEECLAEFLSFTQEKNVFINLKP